MIKGTPQTQKFFPSRILSVPCRRKRRPVRVDGGKWKVDETRQSFFIIFPLWWDNCVVVNGLYSCCTRQLFVCWTGSGNQGPPPQTIGPFPSSFSHGWRRLHYSRGTTHNTTRWLDVVHPGSMSNTTKTTTGLTFRRQHLASSSCIRSCTTQIPQLLRCPLSTFPPSCSFQSRHVYCVSTDGFR